MFHFGRHFKLGHTGFNPRFNVFVRQISNAVGGTQGLEFGFVFIFAQSGNKAVRFHKSAGAEESAGDIRFFRSVKPGAGQTQLAGFFYRGHDAAAVVADDFHIRGKFAKRFHIQFPRKAGDAFGVYQKYGFVRVKIKSGQIKLVQVVGYDVPVQFVFAHLFSKRCDAFIGIIFLSHSFTALQNVYTDMIQF